MAGRHSDNYWYLLGRGGGSGSSSGLSGSINSSGQIVGQSGFGPTLWQNGAATNLQWPGGNNGTAYAINDSGQIVGTALNPNGVNYYDGVQWQNGVLAYLTDLGYQYSQALDNNNSGDIVGFSRSSAPDQFGPSTIDAILWQNGATVDLTTLIEDAFGPVGNARAFAINNKGQIAVDAQYNNASSVFLFTPTSIPEPPSWAIVLTELLGIAAIALLSRVQRHRLP